MKMLRLEVSGFSGTRRPVTEGLGPERGRPAGPPGCLLLPVHPSWLCRLETADAQGPGFSRGKSIWREAVPRVSVPATRSGDTGAGGRGVPGPRASRGGSDCALRSRLGKAPHCARGLFSARATGAPVEATLPAGKGERSGGTLALRPGTFLLMAEAVGSCSLCPGAVLVGSQQPYSWPRRPGQWFESWALVGQQALTEHQVQVRPCADTVWSCPQGVPF